MARKRFDGDTWYYTSEDARQTVSDFGVEQSLYLDDLEALSLSRQPERRPEYEQVARLWFQSRKQHG